MNHILLHHYRLVGGGMFIMTGDNTYLQPGERPDRENLRWTDAAEELVKRQFATKLEKDSYRLTELGYQVAEKLIVEGAVLERPASASS